MYLPVLAPLKDPLAFIWFGLFLASFFPLIAAQVRRVRDATGNGAYYLLVLIPFLGGLAVTAITFLPSKVAPSRYR